MSVLVNIRPARPEDCQEIMRLIIELAIFEKLEDQVKIDAEDSQKLVGYALYFPIYSTWMGVCLHLEDIYVTPDYRGTGLGKRLLQTVTKAALEMGCARLQLSVLGWNKVAKDLYTRLGWTDLTEAEDWHSMRLTREGMESLVNKRLCGSNWSPSLKSCMEMLTAAFFRIINVNV